MSTLYNDVTAGKVSRYDNGYLRFGLIYTDLVIRVTGMCLLKLILCIKLAMEQHTYGEK